MIFSNNKSTISWTLSSIGGIEVYYSTGATTVKINGTQVYYKDRVNWDEYVFPAAKGSISGTTVINHASDGTASITVELSTAVYIYEVTTQNEVSYEQKNDHHRNTYIDHFQPHYEMYGVFQSYFSFQHDRR